jgi:hypothetical protein
MSNEQRPVIRISAPPAPVQPNGEERARRKSARTKFQESFKHEGVEPRSRTVREVPATEPHEFGRLGFSRLAGC